MKRVSLVLLLGCIAALCALLSSCETIDTPTVSINPDGTVAISDSDTGITILVPAFTPSK